jgi:hypothetical protein
MRRLIVAFGLLVLASHPAWAAAPIVSGAYADAMLIGYDPATGVVSGYFDMERGEQPSFSCIFYLKGTLAGGAAAIETYFPETPADDLIRGQLKLKDATHFQVQLPTDHGGCMNVESFTDKDMPATFDLQAAHPWTGVAVVSRDKTHLFDTPAAAAPRKAYLVKGDGVGVRSSRPGWLQVDYVGGDKTVSGWIKAADAYPSR